MWFITVSGWSYQLVPYARNDQYFIKVDSSLMSDVHQCHDSGYYIVDL